MIDVQRRAAAVQRDPATVMRVVAEGAQELVVADGATVELVEGDELVCAAAIGSAASRLGLRVKAATSTSGLCMRLAAPVRFSDSEVDSRLALDASRRDGARSIVVVPLLLHGAPMGVLKVEAARAHAFALSAEQVLTPLARFIVGAMRQANPHTERHQPHRDTGSTVPYRRRFLDSLDPSLSEVGEELSDVTALFLDLDGVSGIDDALGRDARDRLRTDIARRLAAAVRGGDVVTRLDDDEFVVLCRNLQPRARSALVRRLRRAVVSAEPAGFARVSIGTERGRRG